MCNSLSQTLTQVIKKSLVLASVLKPVTDTRMFEKLGCTLAENPEMDVHIIGFPAGTLPYAKGITFHEVFRKPFYRLSVQRFVAWFKILIRLCRLRPNIIIVTTHELLAAACLCRCFFGSRLYYDVQENYFYNIRHTPAFPVWLRLPLAAWVRAKERLLAGCVDGFLLAERGYIQELKFARPYVVLENKLPKRFVRASTCNNRLRLLFTGTLAPTTGVLQAIEVAVNLHRIDARITLTIAGHVTQKHFLARIQEKVSAHPFINLRAGLHPIDHTLILNEISQAGTGIIIYPPNPSTASSIPTKVFEYLGMGLPVLVRHNTATHQLVNQCQGGIVLPQVIDYEWLYQELMHLPPPLTHPQLYWESQVHELRKILNI